MMAFFAVVLLPIAWSLGVQDGAVLDFVAAALINVFAGLAVATATRRFRRELKPRDGFLLVTLSWALMSASAAVPFMIAFPDLGFTDAYFEAASGLTTTGSTVLNHLDDLPQSINLWRHTLHWIGGIGIIVLAVAVLPLLGVGGMQLYKAETPGPVKDEKLTPRITETAKSLWFTYLAITVVGVVALRIAGMGWFDADCHCFSAIALEHPLALDDNGHGRGDEIGPIAGDDKVDFVDIEELAVDAWHSGRLGLVVIVDQLHGPSDEAAFLVDLLLPDLHGQESGFAIGSKGPGEGHAQANADGRGGLTPRCQGDDQHERPE